MDNGIDFAQLAKKHSQDSKKDVGGDWGWVERKALIPEVAEVAFELGISEHSQPLRLKDKIFIMYIQDRRDEDYVPLTEVRDNIAVCLYLKWPRKPRIGNSSVYVGTVTFADSIRRFLFSLLCWARYKEVEWIGICLNSRFSRAQEPVYAPVFCGHS